MSPLPDRLLPLFAKTKVICFGHFIVTVPATATVVYGPAQVDGEIFYMPGKGSKVAEELAMELAEVEEHRKFIDADAPEFRLFGKAIDGAIPGQKLVFGSKDHAMLSISSIIPLGNDLYVQEISSSLPKQVDQDIAVLNNVAKHMRSRAENEIPTEPGMCIEGAFVSLLSTYETARVGIRFKEFPDVHFSIETHKNQAHLVESSDLKTLLEHAEKEAPKGFGSWRSRIKYFRRGQRQLGKWDGFEVLARKPAQENSDDSHEFQYTSLGAVNDPLHPELDLQLDTGVANNLQGGTKPSITDEEAVALWDKLVTSIRARPVGSAATTGSKEAPKVPLGERAVTGRTCTQTGWWECEEEADVVGERRRLLKAGTKFPKVTLFDKPGIWKKLQGKRPIYELATVWQLVAYAADEATLPASDTEPPALA